MFIKKGFLRISSNSKEKPVPESVSDEVVGFQLNTDVQEHLFQWSLWSDCFCIFKSSSMSGFYKKELKMTSLEAIFWQYSRLWKCFLLIEMLGSHHPEQVLKIWNILIGGVSLPLNLNHKCCKLLHSSCGSRRSAEFSCWSKKKKKKKKKKKSRG